jgi:hypothetical protein
MGYLPGVDMTHLGGGGQKDKGAVSDDKNHSFVIN